MKKPDKPRIENLPALFRRLFSQKKIQNPDLRKQSPRWQAKSVQTNSVWENLIVDPATRFRNLTPRGVTSTPLQISPPLNTPSLDPHSEDSVNTVHTLPVTQAVIPEPKLVKTPSVRRRFFEPAKTLPAFWTVASIFSLIVNVILIVALVLLGRQLFVLKSIVGDKLLGGLYENFIFMDQAHIKTNITVSDNIPINFTLPISQDTMVVLTQNTSISGANVRINTGGITINSSANIVLPAGSKLPVHLELNVPVTTTVPININVPVDIPLQQTELHKPFIGLQQVVAPFYGLLQPQVKQSQDMPFCEPFASFCSFYFQQ